MDNGIENKISNDIWSRISIIYQMQYELQKLNELASDIFKISITEPLSNGSFPIFQPRVDILEIGEEIQVVADLPGVEKKSLKVLALGPTIFIKGERKKNLDPKNRFYRVERSHGKFSRHLSLPADIDPSQARASFENGELNILFKKSSSPAESRIKSKVTIKIG